MDLVQVKLEESEQSEEDAGPAEPRTLEAELAELVGGSSKTSATRR